MKCYITSIPACDGFGARFQRSLNLLFFAKHIQSTYNKDIEFIYSPLSYEGFGKNFYDRPSTNFYYTTKEVYKERAISWEEKINYNGKKITDIDINSLVVVFNPSYSQLMNDISNNLFNNKLYLYGQLTEYDTIDTEIFSKYRKELSNKFDIKNPFNNDKLNISLHIRRDDVSETMNINRWVSDEYYLDIIDNIKENTNREINLNIHTQKQNFNFEKFKDYNVLYDEMCEDYDSFLEFIFSDILVLGKSSFSYSAALLNSNIVVYNDFWHTKLKDWIYSDELKEKIKNYER